MPFDKVRAANPEVRLLDEIWREPVQHESHGKQNPASWTIRERGNQQKAGSDQVEGP